MSNDDSTASESQLRLAWTIGSKVEIYSNSKAKWFAGDVAQVFTDDEGEWLEVRYDSTMSKQVQRYSTDIRPLKPDPSKTKSPKQNISNTITTSTTNTNNHSTINTSSTTISSNPSTSVSPVPIVNSDLPFSPDEMEVRSEWKKGHHVEIFSNTHQEWFLGEIVDIVKDEEGEWLNVVWQRKNGEAMSKQVQRFSSDVRPPLTEIGSDSDDEGATKQNKSKNNNGTIGVNTTVTNPTNKTTSDNKSINNTTSSNNNVRRAPRFSRTLKASTHSYPATSSFRKLKKLNDIVEEDESSLDSSGVSSTIVGKNSHEITSNLQSKQKIAQLENWNPKQVQDWIGSIGKPYEKYKIKFKNISGLELIQLEEENFKAMNIPKFHRLKIMLELTKIGDLKRGKLLEETKGIEVLNWNPSQVAQWITKQSDPFNIYADKFEQQGVDGLLLLELDDDDLDTIGVKQFHRKKILDLIRDYAKKIFPDDDTSNSINSNNKKHNNDKEQKTQEEHKDEEAIKNNRKKRRQSIQLPKGQNITSNIAQGELLDLLNDMSNMISLLSLTLADNLKENAAALREKTSGFISKYTSHEILIENKSNEEHEDSLTPIEKHSPKSNISVMAAEREDNMKNLFGHQDSNFTQNAINYLHTLDGRKGHKRRQSLTLNSTDLSQDDDEDDDDDHNNNKNNNDKNGEDETHEDQEDEEEDLSDLD